MTKLNLSAKFGKILKAAREQKGLSQEALAELAEVDRTYVSMVERGKRQPTLGVAKRLADALKEPLGDMIRRAERDS
jgi:transcriptional regulator with XRE-family HTH domain